QLGARHFVHAHAAAVECEALRADRFPGAQHGRNLRLHGDVRTGHDLADAIDAAHGGSFAVHSREILACLTIPAKRAESSSCARATAAASAAQASKPKVSKRCRTDGAASAAVMSAFRRLTTSGGVPFGAKAATQVFNSKPAGPPACATVGTSGYSARRLGAASASSFTRPA